MKCLFGFLLVFTCSSLVTAAGIDPHQMSDWRIVVLQDDQHDRPQERYAAEEFQTLFQSAVGIQLPIEPVAAADLTTHGASAKKSIYIATAANRAMFRDRVFQSEEVAYRVEKNRLGLTGGGPRGPIYAVYEFFERVFGVRFLTFDHTYVPPLKENFRIPLTDHTYASPFSFRWSYYKANSDHHAFATRLRVNTVATEKKYGGKTKQHLISHTLAQLLPPAKYGKEHPEYFALVDGRRSLARDAQPCVTNPDVLEIVSQHVIEELDAHPDLANISVSQNDNNAYCTCDACEAINRREGTPMGAHLAFVNAVADRVAKKYPHVKVGTLAYSYTRKPPKTIVPRKNVQIQLCSIECCTLHAINDPACEKNREFCRDMEQWRKICNDIWIWNYNTNFDNYDLPFPNLRSIGANVRFFRDNHAKGIFMQANGNGHAGEFCDLRNYVIARCLWNPDLDSWPLTEEFCRLHYGKAAGPILEHLRLIHDNAEAAGVHPECFPKPEEVGLTLEIAVKSVHFFQQALALADNEIIRRRVEKASICAYKALIEMAGLQWNDGVAKFDFPAGMENTFDRYVKLCRKYHMDRTAERKTFDEAMIPLQEYSAGIATAQVETDLWKLTALPADNGNLVELIYLPTGRNLVEAPASRYLNRQRSFEERGRQGYDHEKPLGFASHVEGNTLVLSKTLEDGSTLKRLIHVGTLANPSIRFETHLTHRGKTPRTYQFEVHPEYDAGTASNKAETLGVYIKNQDWVLFNTDWQIDRGPRQDLLKTAQGGGFAYYNHKRGFGVRETYDPKAFEKPFLHWMPERKQLQLQLTTRAVKLQPQQSYSFSYQIDYLRNPPQPSIAVRR